MWWKVASIWFFFTSGGLLWNCFGHFNWATLLSALFLAFVGVMFTWAMFEEEDKDKKQKKDKNL